jgi:hypothetical protein
MFSSGERIAWRNRLAVNGNTDSRSGQPIDGKARQAIFVNAENAAGET